MDALVLADLHQLCTDTECSLEDLPRMMDDRDLRAVRGT